MHPGGGEGIEQEIPSTERPFPRGQLLPPPWENRMPLLSCHEKNDGMNDETYPRYIYTNAIACEQFFKTTVHPLATYIRYEQNLGRIPPPPRPRGRRGAVLSSVIYGTTLVTSRVSQHLEHVFALSVLCGSPFLTLGRSREGQHLLKARRR